MRLTRKEFETLVVDGFARLPEEYRRKVRNVGFVVEDEPSAETRKEVGLRGDETLLGFYRGIPRTARGEDYGVGPTLPDVIYIYQKPTEEEARYRMAEKRFSFSVRPHTNATLTRDAFTETVREVVAETIWHEVAHHFGLDEDEVARREKRRA